MVVSAGVSSVGFVVDYPAGLEPTGGWDRYEMKACLTSDEDDCKPPQTCAVGDNVCDYSVADLDDGTQYTVQASFWQCAMGNMGKNPKVAICATE